MTVQTLCFINFALELTVIGFVVKFNHKKLNITELMIFLGLPFLGLVFWIESVLETFLERIIGSTALTQIGFADIIFISMYLIPFFIVVFKLRSRNRS